MIDLILWICTALGVFALFVAFGTQFASSKIVRYWTLRHGINNVAYGWIFFVIFAFWPVEWVRAILWLRRQSP